jgi:hypothetical protein
MWKMLYMFWAVPPPIIRKAKGYLQHLVFVAPLLLSAAIVLSFTIAADSSNGVTIPDAVGTVICTPDDGWWYQPKHLEQFPHKIKCVTLHLVEYILE